MLLMAMLRAEKNAPRVVPLSRKPDDDAILTVPELASLLKVTPGYIYNLICDGRLTKEDGVRHLGPHCTRIVKVVFMKRLEEGKLTFQSRDRLPSIFKNHGSLGLKFAIQVAGRRIALREYNGRKDNKEGRQLARADLAKLKKWLTLGELTAGTHAKYFPASPNIAKLQALGVQVERPDKIVPTLEAFIGNFIGAKESTVTRRQPRNS
jgi:hypothetical protein